ncbi:hypothetical protein B0H13DRAFT_1993568 [Mycena leptocephala]|nr:hypothetical protein B0H13DRAFT_1993568 [Mycena leptocephala]
MPKSRVRLTTKKRTKPTRIALGREKNAPTAEEWAVMPQYITFQVSDEDDNNYDFSVDDIARVLPNGCKVGKPIEAHEYWIGKILDVRAKGATDVWWVQIHWFYSARDAAAVDRTFDASHCGKYERLQSNHVDCVSSSVFDGLAVVKYYDETDLDQESILPDEFYYRYTINVSDNSISPAPRATCICSCLYNPTDPRPGLGHALLPTTSLPLNESASAEPPKKRRRASHATTTISNPAPFDALLAALPSALVRAAAQPIVRGGVFGVAGNAAAVVAARRIVCGALRDSTGADGWEKQMPDGWEKTMPQGWDVEDVVLGGANAGENGVSPSKLSVSAGAVRGTAPTGKEKRRSTRWWCCSVQSAGGRYTEAPEFG